MKKTLILSAMIASTFVYAQKQNKIEYPKTKMQAASATYFGQRINDPYQWLEDDRSEQTEQWVKEQNKVTFDYLQQISFRDKLKSQLKDKWNYEKIGSPFKEGDYTYYFKNNGLQNQSVLYRKDKNGKEEIFLDPNTFSTDGTTSLADVSFTKDGSLMAYAISEGGSDWRKIIVLDTKTKKQIGETLVDVKFSSITWYKNEGFYYSSYDKPTGSEFSAMTDQHKLYYHKLNTPQKTDKLIFGNNIKRRYISADITDDFRYLIISTANTTSGNEVYLMDLKNNDKPLQINQGFDYSYSIVDYKDGLFYILTNYQSPNKKLVATKYENLTKHNTWKTIIPETNDVLSVSTAGEYLFALYTKDAISLIKQMDYNGKVVREINLPGAGTATGFSAKKSEKEVYYSFTNYITPPTIYKMNLKTGVSEVYMPSKAKFDASQYESKQVFYTSKDGTKVPMIISYKKGIKLNGKNPTILYGYGGFNVSLTPSFSIANAVWMENGGVYAVANLRGGGEYGRKWHDAGTKLQKQNVFDDFIAAAEYLINNQYSLPNYLAIKGGSNGGLLVGATMTQRPELFKVAIPAVGVLDMLRYHKFTAGAGWAYDYGTADDSKEMFQYLKNYSPVHNVKKGVSYPATLVVTADHDDRVVPAHSYKFIAELQAKQNGNNPVLIRIDVNAGHGAGKSMEQIINENADIQSFILYNMGKEI